MKKFTFSLQKILDIREFEEKQAQIELGKAVAETNRIRMELERIAAERVRIVHLKADVVSLTEMIVKEQYLTRLDMTKDRLLEDLAAAEIVVEEKRAVFTEALKKRKVLSRLKDRQFTAFRRDVQKAEDIVSDDISSSRFLRDNLSNI